jgi:hypothetical protein
MVRIWIRIRIRNSELDPDAGGQLSRVPLDPDPVYLSLCPGLDLDLGTGVAAAAFPPPPAAIQVPVADYATFRNMCIIVNGAVISDTRLIFTIGCREVRE